MRGSLKGHLMSKHLLSLTAAALVCAMLGCGGGEYARRVARRVDELNAQFAENFDEPTELPGMRAVLYRPLKQLGKSLQEKTAAGKEFPPQRLQPPIVLPFPLRATYEVFAKVQDEDGGVRRVPFYCYLLSEENVKQRDPFYVVTERAQGLIGDELEGPRNIDCQARDGKVTQWRWLRGTHKWLFFTEEVEQTAGDKKAGKKTAASKPTGKSEDQTSPSPTGDSDQQPDGQAEPPQQQPAESEGSPAASDGRLEATIEIYARRQGGDIVVIIWLTPQILERAEGVENPPPSEQLRRQFAGNVQFLSK